MTDKLQVPLTTATPDQSKDKESIGPKTGSFFKDKMKHHHRDQRYRHTHLPPPAAGLLKKTAAADEAAKALGAVIDSPDMTSEVNVICEKSF